MPGGSVFIDTNVLLYTRQIDEEEKAVRAGTWLEHLARAQSGRTNLQVLNEFASALFRKRTDLSADDVFAAVDEVRFLGASPLNWEIVAGARQIRLRYRYSWWDCLLLASALELGCTHFLTEDLQDGQTIEDAGARSLTIVDSFAHSPEQILSPS